MKRLGLRRRIPTKVEKMPKEIVEAVNRKLADGVSYKDIVQFINDIGRGPISKQSISKYARHWATITDRVMQARESCQVLVQAIKENPNSDMAEAAEQMMFTKLIDMIANSFDEESKSDPHKLAAAIAQVQQAGLRREKLKLEFKKYFDKAGASAFGHFFRDLMEYFELIDKSMAAVIATHFDCFAEWIRIKYTGGAPSIKLRKRGEVYQIEGGDVDGRPEPE